MNTILKTIKTAADVRAVPLDRLNDLAEEIRKRILSAVSRNGGHLASNLGVVELTLALHYVFDFSADRLVFDVGHQCYTHKLLTGRNERFDTLRQKDGISGFPSPAEHPADPFFVGHAGTAVATAVGLAVAAQMQNLPQKIVAFVGDASIVNGLSFEGLNNTTLVKRQLLIILNDNTMAIDKTQGAFANYLTQLRLTPSMELLQQRTRRLVDRMPLGQTIHESLHRLKDGLKTSVLGQQKFEQLRIPTFGPVDGHDILSLIKILAVLRDMEYPVILHVQTEKGRGAAFASQDPCTFHSPQPFEIDGDHALFPQDSGKTFTACFSEALAVRMRNDPRVVALTAAMPDGTGLADLRTEFPDRVVDVGIAESAAVAIAAGMAKNGLKPVVAIYSTFLQRSFDQIFHEVCLQDLPVVFCLDRGGFVGGDGAVHHGFCDIAFLRCLPNMVLAAPANEPEMHEALKFALACGKPCALRYPRDRVPSLSTLPPEYRCPPFETGHSVTLQTGSAGTILAYGSTAMDASLAAQRLRNQGIDLTVINARFAKPLDSGTLSRILSESPARPLFTVEDHALMGGFGSAVLEFAQEHRLDTSRIVRLGMPDAFIHQNTRKGQLQQAGIDAAGIETKIRDYVRPG